MNIKVIEILNCFLFLFILSSSSTDIKCLEPGSKQNTENTQQGAESYQQKDNKVNMSIFDRHIDFLLPKWDFQRPDKFKKEKYNKITRYVSDYKKKNENLKDVFVFPEDIIEESENFYKKEVLEALIKKEVNIEDTKYNLNHEIFGFPDSRTFRNALPKFIPNENVEIKNFSEMGDLISFEPKLLQINDKPVCIPTMALLNIRNTKTDNILLKSIKSDLYQVTIFYFRGKDSSQTYNQKNLYPKTIQAGESMIFQIIILPDMIGEIKGNIYLELNDNKVVIYPIQVNAIDNIYKVQPIYSPNWLGSRLLTLPLNIYNPHNKVLIIKEVINSFSSINLVWPNGQPVSSNHTSISSSMLEIPPKSTKKIMEINFYKEVPGVEYGLLQMKTDKDTLIIPVLVRVEVQGIRVYPNYYNFGLIDLNKKVKRVIPVTVSNVYKAPIQIKSFYTSFEENLVEYLPNLSNYLCHSEKIQLSNLLSGGHKSHTTSSSYEPNLCIIHPVETIYNFGYIMIDPSNYLSEVNDQSLFKKVRGSIVLETNFIENPFIELFYEYYLDRNSFTYDEKQLNLYYNNNQLSYHYEIAANLKSSFSYHKDEVILDAEHISFKLTDYDSSQMTNSTIDKPIKIEVILKNPTTFNNKKHYFLPIKTNMNMISIIPFRFYDKGLELHYCDNTALISECHEENFATYKQINYKQTSIVTDFGMTTTTETGKKYFHILNDNEDDVKIVDIETTSLHVVITMDSLEDLYTNEKLINSWESGKLPRALKKKLSNQSNDIISIVIPKNSIVSFTVNIVTHIEQDITGIVTLTFSNNFKLTINVSAQFLKGSLNITPSVIRFEPAFPGLFQTKLISSKSSYNIPVNMQSVKSSDPRIIPIVLTNSIISNNRTEILKVVFDPSRVQLDENFMRGDFNLNTTNRYLTFKELYLWKEKQKLWELLGSQGRTEINTSVKIKTNIQTENVNVRAFLTKPSLVKKDEIDFGLVQIGETVNKYIEVFNPSDESMTIQVLLASEEFADIHNNSMFSKNKKFRFSTSNQITVMDCHFFNSTSFDSLSSNFTQNLISKTQKDKKKKKKMEFDGIDYTNSILIEEDLPQSMINNRNINKIELLKKIFLYSNQNTKPAFINTERLICNSNFIGKNEIILDNSKDLIEKIFSDEFSKEIPIIKKMTDCSPPSSSKNQGKENSIGFFERIAQSLKIIFKTDTPTARKRRSDENKKQEFYLPKIVSSQTYNIKPHQKLKIGPIIFHPTNFTNSTAALFIKNNLTILYPIKIKGNGGSGVLQFYSSEKDIENNNIIKETRIEKLTFLIDSLTIGEENEHFSKSIKMKNLGNLPFKVNNISIENSGCEAYGIKIHNCDSINLKPDEIHKITISVRPDFNFYFIEKDIHFESQYQTVILRVSINISNDLLSTKNRLFNYDNLKSYGYISVLVVIFIVSVILYILSIEYAEMNIIKGRPAAHIEFISTKELIENNPMLRFENLFIKSYRKFNQGFYDDFVGKQMDKPGTGNYDMEGLSSDKKKIKSGLRGDQQDNDELVNEKEKGINESNTNIENKEQKEKPSVKKTTDKSKATKGKIITTKKPIGMALKPNEKREEEKRIPIQTENATQPNQSNVNKFDAYSNPNPNPNAYQYNTPNPENYNQEGLQQPNWDNSAYNNAGFWPGGYNNYYNKQIQQPRYDHHTNRYNYYGQKQQPGYTQNNLYNLNAYNNMKANVNQQASSSFKSTENANKDSKEDSGKNLPTIEKKKSDNNQGQELENRASNPTSNTLRDQFISFMPDLFNKNKQDKDDKSNKNDEIERKIIQAPEEEHSDKEKEVNNELIGNFKNMDFTTIFAKEPSNFNNQQHEDYEDDNKHFIEDDASSHNYQSEKDKFGDSGAEEIKFNFNSIFGGNTIKYIQPVNYANDYTDNDEPKQNIDGNKPYFDKNLFLSFDSAFTKPQTGGGIFTNNGSGLFSSNPFSSSTNNNKNSLLSELRDDDIADTKEWEEKRDKLDDVAEDDDEYDGEEDPEWDTDNVDIKKEGFFDETGTYKLKQIDFNFDFDFKIKK